ncbi:glycosyltransferase [Marivirga sp.]|uniref:glycosyltransferase n=1 Tax=Marivirga sp. TaxID=2018662 RepID=UPI0025FCD2C8|nr:glycosyltransferase [Marivirga sp.]
MPVKVVVICLCFNHEKYVEEAMKSVLAQTYPTELIVVDDDSNDNSIQKITSFVKLHSDINIKTLFFEKNVGNCKAFNSALELINADYIIDLAADDILLPNRVEEGVKNMETYKEAAVNFTNANYIDEKGLYIKSHYAVSKSGKSLKDVSEGELFTQILERYFICPPTLMFRASFLRKVGGYDEELAYEDFDVMLRLSRFHPFTYADKILVEKRKLSNSLSTNQYKKGNKQLSSTLKICLKAFEMIENKMEKRALLKRLIYESKQAFINKRFLLFSSFISLGFKTILQK